MSRPFWQPPEGIDWSRPASHIGAECGVSTPTVTAYLRRAGLPVRAKGTPKGTRWSRAGRLEPATLDWTRQDVALAQAHGVCRERIRQLRKAAGLPASGSAEWLAAGGVVTHFSKKFRLVVDGASKPENFGSTK
jgi:hypothetical protein